MRLVRNLSCLIILISLSGCQTADELVEQKKQQDTFYRTEFTTIAGICEEALFQEGIPEQKLRDAKFEKNTLRLTKRPSYYKAVGKLKFRNTHIGLPYPEAPEI